MEIITLSDRNSKHEMFNNNKNVFNDNCWNAFLIMMLIIVSITVANPTLGQDHRCWDVFIYLGGSQSSSS